MWAFLERRAVAWCCRAVLDAVVLTSEPSDFERLGAQFPGVTVLSV